MTFFARFDKLDHNDDEDQDLSDSEYEDRWRPMSEVDELEMFILTILFFLIFSFNLEIFEARQS